MSSNRKGFSTVVLLAIVTTLLSCCCSPASSFAFLPRVSRTNDAVIIDFASVGYASYDKSLFGQIVSPGFVPLPSFNLHPMAYRQQQQDPSGWSYSFGHPSPIAFEDAWFSKQAVAATTQCGKGPTALPKRPLMSERVTGGDATEAKANAWPFLVTLRKYSENAQLLQIGINYDEFCSGTLISDTKVLSAASCLEKMSLYEMSGVTVAAGMTSNKETGVADVQMTRRISKVVLHSKFNAFTHANDIAIITLDAPVVLSRTVGTVCLPPASTEIDQYADQSAVIIGWGLPTSEAPFNKLSQGTVSILPNSDCKADTNFGKYVTDANICLKSEDIKAICDEDIGGPVVVLSSPGIWTQVGINSYVKEGCEVTSLQTRVSAFKAWIDTYSAN
ncbi:chymotrypsin-like elastase family member 2A isoform X2 [Daphnia pulex]|uniref:chymotrypsin-like elastase family member 2A isoform X2 n=1 Tax=Daphnia pulex TaxID=6669 RepID=UPI001EE0C352|nr:chymotrypsin-like elastase family member 2A isoform X2 [Daphnia pulex]